MSQSIFIIKHMPNAVCGCEDTGLLFIHLIYLYFFPEGETLVSIHLCWLLAITEHLEPLLNWPEGNRILERSTCFRAKRCVCSVCFCGDGTAFSQERWQHIHLTSPKKERYVERDVPVCHCALQVFGGELQPSGAKKKVSVLGKQIFQWPNFFFRNSQN